MGEGRCEKERLAWLREENEIAWVSFAARRTVSLSAQLNKDRKPDNRGLLGCPETPLHSLLLRLVCISASQKGNFQRCWIPNLGRISANLFLKAQDQQEKEAGPLGDWPCLLREPSHQPAWADTCYLLLSGEEVSCVIRWSEKPWL